ncbi:hypothetical protein BH24ACT22_BH24ACT22_06060 [soil metagenome]
MEDKQRTITGLVRYVLMLIVIVFGGLLRVVLLVLLLLGFCAIVVWIAVNFG